MNWNAISSRVVTARLELVRRGQRRSDGPEVVKVYSSLWCACAPTAKAPARIKEGFFF